MTWRDEARQRLAAATPRPWRTGGREYALRGYVWVAEERDHGDTICQNARLADAELIAHAPTDLERALELIDKLILDGDALADAIDAHRENPTEQTGHGIGIALMAWRERAKEDA